MTEGKHGVVYKRCAEALDDGQTLVAEYRDGPEIKTGDTLHFSYPPDRLRLFHKNGNKLG